MCSAYDEIPLFLEEVKKYDKIVMTGHTSPDGDAICSIFALANALKKWGKNCIIILEEYADTYDYIDGHKMVFKGSKEEILKLDVKLFISADCGSLDRFDDLKDLYDKADKRVNIDHHISNNNFGDINIVNTKASSTCEIMFEIISQMGLLDKNIATALYTGIIFDTSGFKHNTTSERTHIIASELLSYGVDNSFIHTRLLYTHTFTNAKLLAKTILNASIKNGIVVGTLSKEDITSLGKDAYMQTEGISGYLLDIKDVDIAIFIYQKDNLSVKVSFRAKNFNVNIIAKSFGGGGHKLASGATFNTSIEEAKRLVLDEIYKYM